jgi:CheY-like chemotaxis protein
MAEQRKKTVLIVEDEPSQLMVLRDELAYSGFEVLTAGSGEEGLSIALARRPDAILLDMMMPYMDGETMLLHLRKDKEWGRQVPVIVLTNMIPDDEKRMKNIRKSGVTQYLVKSSWPLEAIVDVIKRKVR